MFVTEYEEEEKLVHILKYIQTVPYLYNKY